jgi:hypothetical protein
MVGELQQCLGGRKSGGSARAEKTARGSPRAVAEDDSPDADLIGMADGEPGGRARTSGERVEGEAAVDLVDEQSAAGPQGIPRRLLLEADVAAGVEAVVNEQVDLAELGEKPRKPRAARSLDVCPAAASGAHRS